MGGILRIFHILHVFQAEEALQALEDVQNLPICAAGEEQQKKFRLFSRKLKYFLHFFRICI